MNHHAVENFDWSYGWAIIRCDNRCTWPHYLTTLGIHPHFINRRKGKRDYPNKSEKKKQMQFFEGTTAGVDLLIAQAKLEKK